MLQAGAAGGVAGGERGGHWRAVDQLGGVEPTTGALRLLRLVVLLPASTLSPPTCCLGLCREIDGLQMHGRGALKLSSMLRSNIPCCILCSSFVHRRHTHLSDCNTKSLWKEVVMVVSKTLCSVHHADAGLRFPRLQKILVAPAFALRHHPKPAPILGNPQTP